MSRYDILILRQDLLWFLVQMIPKGYWNKTMSKREKLKCAHLNLLPVLNLKNLSCGVIKGKETDVTHQFYSIRQEENKKESRTEEEEVNKFMKIINKFMKIINSQRLFFYPSDPYRVIPVFSIVMGSERAEHKNSFRCSLS